MAWLLKVATLASLSTVVLGDGDTCVELGSSSCASSKESCCHGDCVDDTCVVGYTGGGCSVIGPRDGNLVMQFLAMGDSPYDSVADPPLYEGHQYNCIRDSMVPGVAQMDPTPAFLAHIGDIKRGNATGTDDSCNRRLFDSRRNLFARFEEMIDFLLVVGDNEWNECSGFVPDTNPDPVKQLWRHKFTTPPFRSLDHNKEAHKLQRQSGYPENFFFRQSGVAFLGITEPGGDHASDDVNRNWTDSKLTTKHDAIVIFAHAGVSNTIINGLRNYFERHGAVATLVVKGNTHPSTFCLEHDPTFKTDNVLTLTVEPFQASPLLVSLYEVDSKIFFAVDSAGIGCS